jgi:hypothetical protein
MIGDLSPFEELRLLQPASVHIFTAGKHESAVTYWAPKFHSTPDYDRTKTKRVLIDTIVESVRRCCDSKQIIVSLSGGHDSSAILAVLRDALQIKNVLCLSYAQGNPKSHSDPAVAAQQAQACGYRHLVRRSHNGDLLHTIFRNAELGEGVAYFCQEVDAWCELFKEPELPSDSVLLAGDEWFGWRDREFESTNDVLRSIYVLDVSAIAALKPLVGDDTFNRWCHLIGNEIEALLRSTHNPDDLHDQKDELFLQHRIPHVVMPWRRFIIGNSLPVHLPFLDQDVLDLMTEVPVQDRRGKLLYREAVTEAFPRVFKIPRAYYEQAGVRKWIPELQRQEAAIADWIKLTPSLLDAVIAPERQLDIVRGLLHSQTASNEVSGLTLLRERVRNAVFDLGLRSMVERVRRHGRLSHRWAPVTVPNSLLVIRLLTMRAFLAA